MQHFNSPFFPFPLLLSPKIVSPVVVTSAILKKGATPSTAVNLATAVVSEATGKVPAATSKKCSETGCASWVFSAGLCKVHLSKKPSTIAEVPTPIMGGTYAAAKIAVSKKIGRVQLVQVTSNNNQV